MASSSSMSLKATPAVVCGIQGSTETVSKWLDCLPVHADGLDRCNNSLVVSKLDDK